MICSTAYIAHAVCDFAFHLLIRQLQNKLTCGLHETGAAGNIK